MSESLQHDVKKTGQVEAHTEQGQAVLPWAIAVTVVSAGVAAEPCLRRRLGTTPINVVGGVLIFAAAISGVGATWTVIEVGHSGATAVWHYLPPVGG